MLYLSNRIKKIILIISIIILTGCSAKYDITINDTKSIEESLNVTENNTELFDKKYEQLYDATLKEYLNTNLNWPTPIYYDAQENPIEPTKIEGIDYYKKKDLSTEKILSINFNNRFNHENYNKSNIINTCYDFNYEKINNVITFKTTSNFKCFEKYELLDDVEINLNTNCHVINSNADIIYKTRYIWRISKRNSDKKINFSLDCTPKKTEKNTTSYKGILVIVVYFIFVLLGMLMLGISYKIKNKL